ncbi:MAG: O-antigen ligase family protein, partial [Anaerolineales bacterium]|nr:O-antigen ligase family protein [Anaerolineales bacterium]
IGGLSLLPQVLSTEDYSLATRLEVLPILAEIVSVNPAFGVGFANYYWFTPLFNLRGFYVSFNSHNNYADLIVQTGLVGMVIYIWLLAQIGHLAWTLRSKVQGGFSIAYVNGAIGGGVGMIVVAFLGDWVLPFVYNIGLLGFRTSVAGWLFLGGLVVLQQLHSTSTKD